VALTIVTREQWGARFGRSSNRVALSSRRFFVAHYPAAAGAVTNEVATVRSIEQQHANQGWSARPGYNFLIGMSGTIYEGCGRDVQGVHCPGRNTDGIGVCFLQGGHAPKMGVQTFSDAAKRSGRALYDELNRATGRTLTQTWHGAHYATACAGPDVIAWVRAGMQAPGGATTPPTQPAPPALPPPEGAMFIRNANTTYQLVHSGPQSYWRSLPAPAAALVPSAWVINDPNGELLRLWRVGAAA
jgi:N-acetylmuramoyl-L-alanine amidase-like protein